MIPPFLPELNLEGMPGFSIEHMQVKLQRLYSIPFLSFVGIIEKLFQIAFYPLKGWVVSETSAAGCQSMLPSRYDSPDRRHFCSPDV